MEIGDVMQGKVINIYKTHLLVRFINDWIGLLHVSEISDYYVLKINAMFQIDHNYWFEIIDMTKNEKKVKLSWKSITPRLMKNPFVFELQETKNGFKNLVENTLKGAASD